jgi:hypothetical protein
VVSAADKSVFETSFFNSSRKSVDTVIFSP